MKFDCIIMNPPYQRNLHLKILAEAIKHLKDEKSKVVNLSPVRWLQDPLAKYKKNSDWHRFQESVSKHIESLDIITSEEGATLFNNRLNVQCGVYRCTRDGNFAHDCSNKIIDKIYAGFKTSTLDGHILYSSPSKFACVVTLICGGAAGGTEKCLPNWMMSKDKAYYTNGLNSKGQTYKEYRDSVIWGNLKPKSEVSHIEFDTETMRENFYNSWSTNILKYMFKMSLVDVNVHPEFLPWMGDSINPRTGKKGYEGEWTDDDFYVFFNITPEEQKVIEETMEKYK